MKLVETTSFASPVEVRTIFSGADTEKENHLAGKFRLHLLGMYHACVGPEWSSRGRLESDYLHHIEVVLSGRRQIAARGKVYDLLPGEIWFLAGNNPVERRCEESCEVLFFKFHCEWLPGVDPLLGWPGREPRCICTFNPEDWSDWRTPGKHASVSEILGMRGRILVWLAKAVPELEDVLREHLRDYTHFTRVFEAIERNLGADLRLPSLAAIHGTSSSAFAMAFTRGTGQSPKEYISRRLNQEALNLVINTELKMKEIAARLRFNDEFYFSRFFQRMNGISPSKYRARFRS